MGLPQLDSEPERIPGGVLVRLPQPIDYSAHTEDRTPPSTDRPSAIAPLLVLIAICAFWASVVWLAWWYAHG